MFLSIKVQTKNGYGEMKRMKYEIPPKYICRGVKSNISLEQFDTFRRE
jgi:hypothetical protein